MALFFCRIEPATFGSLRCAITKRPREIFATRGDSGVINKHRKVRNLGPPACTPPPVKLPRSRLAAQHGVLSTFRSIFRKSISTGFWPDSTVAANWKHSFRSCQRCWNVYAHGGEVWGHTGHHPAALGGRVWPARQHPNDPVCTETEGSRQAGVRRHGAGWPLLAASAHSDDLCE